MNRERVRSRTAASETIKPKIETQRNNGTMKPNENHAFFPLSLSQPSKLKFEFLFKKVQNIR